MATDVRSSLYKLLESDDFCSWTFRHFARKGINTLYFKDAQTDIFRSKEHRVASNIILSFDSSADSDQALLRLMNSWLVYSRRKRLKNEEAIEPHSFYLSRKAFRELQKLSMSYPSQNKTVEALITGHYREMLESTERMKAKAEKERTERKRIKAAKIKNESLFWNRQSVRKEEYDLVVKDRDKLKAQLKRL